MRSLTYIAAAFLPAINSAYAGNAFGGNGDGDTTVVTQTRTVTYCPVIDWMTCDENSYGPTKERTGGPSTSTGPIATSTSTTTVPVTVIVNGTNTSTLSGDPIVTIITTTSGGSVITTTTGGEVITTTLSGSVITTTETPTTITTTTGGSAVTTTITGPEVITTTSGGSVTTLTISGTETLTTTTGGSLTTITQNGTGIITTTGSGSVITTTTGGSVITTTNNATTITTTSTIDPGFGNGTATITSGATTPTGGFGNGTTTTGNSTTGLQNSTSTSLCFNSTRTAAPFNFGKGFGGLCNQPGSRDQWCDGKTVKSDTDPVYRTGVTRTYRLEIGLGSVNADGMSSIASFTINGKTPGDAIIANWGDDVEITVVNTMDPSTGPVNATTIHWHGILQHGTNDQDGVPGVTECGIAPGSSRVYKWHASTFGTSWYHGHLLSQYGGGVRGPIIIHGPASSDYDLDMGTIMIDEKFPSSIFETGKYYATQRGVVVASNYLLNGMNLNRDDPNQGTAARWIVKSGKKHLFRIINSSAQSGFVFHIDYHTMTVISADMTPIVPYVTDSLWIHSGQRYMVVVKADQPVAAYDVRAVVQQGCGTSIANTGLGQSNGVMEYEGSCYTVPAQNGNFTLNTVGICKDELLTNLVPVVKKDAGPSGNFLASLENLAAGTLGGALFGGVAINRWSFGGVTNFTGTANGTATAGINVTYDTPTLQLLPTVGNYSSSIYGNTVFYNAANQWVYWVIQNSFITSHPMHLHGHDFSVLGQAYNAVFDSSMVGTLNFDNPMRRDTVLLYGKGGQPFDPTRVPGYTIIGFQTNNPGAWLMHCHIIWHADLGMGMQIVERPDEIPNYYAKPEFQSECAAMKDYQGGGAGRMKADYESGLKKRHLEEHKFKGYSHGHAIRHE